MISIILLVAALTGCSNSALQQDAVIDSQLSFDSVKESIPTVAEQKVVKTDWEIVREHVTTKYDISEEYFNEHFIFSSVKTVDIKSDRFDSTAKEFPTAIENAKLVRYTLRLNDAAGREYLIKDYLEGVYIHDGKVLDNTELAHVSYRKIAPTEELSVNVDKFTALQNVKNVAACNNAKDFNTKEARDNLNLVFSGSKLTWEWSSNGNSCLISAERPGEVEVMIF